MDEILIQVTEVIEEITIIVSQPTEGGGAVSSVNNKVGAVVLNAADVGADAAGSATTAENNAKAYADALQVGLWDDRGSYNASGNTFPAAGGSGPAGAILKGDIWTVSVAGVLGGVAVSIGDNVRAIADVPGQIAANWSVIENNIGYVPENTARKVNDLTTPSNVDYTSVNGVLSVAHYQWFHDVSETMDFPATRANGQSIKKGDWWDIVGTNTLAGIVVEDKDALSALYDNPGQNPAN